MQPIFIFKSTSNGNVQCWMEKGIRKQDEGLSSLYLKQKESQLLNECYVWVCVCKCKEAKGISKNICQQNVNSVLLSLSHILQFLNVDTIVGRYRCQSWIGEILIFGFETQWIDEMTTY